jgi:hypothetical protein
MLTGINAHDSTDLDNAPLTASRPQWSISMIKDIIVRLETGSRAIRPAILPSPLRKPLTRISSESPSHMRRICAGFSGLHAAGDAT